TGKSKVILEHRAHFLDILIERLDVGLGASERELKLEPGEDGAKVVADARQHCGSLLDLSLDALTHLQEGGARAPHFLGTSWLEIVGRSALAEAFGCFR